MKMRICRNRSSCEVKFRKITTHAYQKAATKEGVTFSVPRVPFDEMETKKGKSHMKQNRCAK